MKYGIKYVFVRSPVIPSIVSSNGRICIFVKLGTYPAALICTTSPNLILKFFLITLFIRIFPSSSLLSTKATHKVYFLFLPLIKMGSPLKILSSAILAWEIWIVELSSPTASSAISLLGAFFESNIAVEKSFLAP